MKHLSFLLLLFSLPFLSFGQDEAKLIGSTPKLTAKINGQHGGFTFFNSGNYRGGLFYITGDQTIRLGRGNDPLANQDFVLKNHGTHAGNFAFGTTPSQHYITVLHNSIKVPGSVNNPNNSAHIALIEDDADDFARLWLLNTNDENRWALIGRTTLDSKAGLAYNGVGKLIVDSMGYTTFNGAYRLPNADGMAGQVLTANANGNVTWQSPTAGSTNAIADTDGDTSIEIENASDADEIYFTVDGQPMVTMKTDTVYIPKGVFSGYGTELPLDPIHIQAEDDDEFAGIYLEGGSNTKHVHCILDNRTANGKKYSLVSVGDDSNIPNGSFAIRDLDNSTERLLIDPQGRVGIDKHNPAYKLDVNGSAAADTLIVSGPGTIGEDLVVGEGIGAKLTIGNDFITDGGADILRTNANFTPDQSETYNLGGSSFKWKNIYASHKIFIQSAEIDEVGTDRLRTDSHWGPKVNNAKDLGESSLRWRDAHINRTIHLGNHEIEALPNGIQVSSNFAPKDDNLQSLGGGSRRWAQVYATTGVINTSDRRAKENIEPLAYGLSEVLALEPVDFNWRNQSNEEKTIGLIAQDLAKIIPEAVVLPQNQDDLYGVKYSDLIPVLIKAIQEQNAKIVALEKANHQLVQISEEVASLKQMLTQLSKKTAEE